MKQQQLSHVLNTQSDGIVVVSKPQIETKEAQDDNEGKTSFQFCNSKSIEMFGTDLRDGQHDILDELLFTPCDLYAREPSTRM